jgi:hypothetical protein
MLVIVNTVQYTNNSVNGPQCCVATIITPDKILYGELWECVRYREKKNPHHNGCTFIGYIDEGQPNTIHNSSTSIKYHWNVQYRSRRD